MGSVYGGIEAGGTKFVCAVGTGPDDLRAITQFATTTPANTIAQAIDFFRQHRGGDRPVAVGIGSFGPVDPNPASPTFGFITTTPKPGWANSDFAGTIQRALGVPVGFDTDVNAAALGEHQWGSAQGLDNFIYLTIGTGIGGGALVNGELLHGLIHPEMGHIFVPHNREVDPFEGSCPYHGDCLEGLASGPAIEKRWRKRGEDLPADHPAWELEAKYLALALANYTGILSPQRIILGGGVMQQPGLLALIRRHTQQFLNDYVHAREIQDEIERHIVSPALGKRAGVLGAIALARQVAK
ncbi:MAG: ROK family protein [Chloroflexi bacterium]|nr:ROK family protein [Chloroflexota bacterium]